MVLEPDGLKINASLSVPRAELEISASRSGGPGGQHVNTSSTRVEVEWNIRSSRALSDDQRALVLRVLAARISAAGTIRVVASETRSQRRNRELAEARLAEIIRRALVVPKKRKKTKPTRGAVERRLTEKKLRSALKGSRRDTHNTD